MTVEFEFFGDQIGRYNGATLRRAIDRGHEVTLCGVRALGPQDRAVILESEPGSDGALFRGGRFRLRDGGGALIAQNLAPDTDMFERLAVGATHLFFTDPSGAKYLVDLEGLPGTPSTLTYAARGRTMERRSEPADKSTEAVRDRVVIALCAGTRVTCDTGRIPVERLTTGARVWTVEDGFQPLAGLHRRTLRLGAANGHLRPVRIAAGALGRGCPSSDLTVAPEQRLLVTGWRAELFFGRDEFLVPAHALLSLPGIARDMDVRSVRYYDLTLPGHHTVELGGILADGSFIGARSRGDIG